MFVLIRYKNHSDIFEQSIQSIVSFPLLHWQYLVNVLRRESQDQNRFSLQNPNLRHFQLIEVDDQNEPRCTALFKKAKQMHGVIPYCQFPHLRQEYISFMPEYFEQELPYIDS